MTEDRKGPINSDKCFFSDEDLNNFLNSGSPQPENISKKDFEEKIENILSISNEKNLIADIQSIIPRELEGNQLNNRFDVFVSAIIMRRNIAQVLARLPGFRTGDLLAKVVERTPLQPRLTVDGKEVVFDGNKYTKIDFMPGDRAHFDAAKMTDSLVRGITGVIEFLAAVDEGRFEAAPVLMGTTNLNMALIAQRLGFSIVDQCRTPDGHIDKTLEKFTVVGKLDDVRTRIEKYRQEKSFKKLQERQLRLQRSLSPATA